MCASEQQAQARFLRHTHTHTHTRAHIHRCTDMRTHTYTCIHTHIHTCRHTHSQRAQSSGRGADNRPLRKSHWTKVLSLRNSHPSVSLTLLSRCHSHTRQPTHLKCTIQWALVYSQSCATITTVDFRILLSPPKETQCPLAIALKPPSPQVLGHH